MAGTKIIILSRRKVAIFCLSIIILLGLAFILDYLQVMPTTGSGIAAAGKEPVILDAGHGGVDSGANLGELKEKDITLDIVLRMKDYLEAKGIGVQITRGTDIDLGGELTKGRHRRDLEARLKLINTGQVAVSIHVNSTNDSSEQGALIFYPRDSEKSKDLADAILQEIVKVQKLNHATSIPKNDLFILRSSQISIVLVEIGFISNPIDREKMVDPVFRQNCAEAIADGIVKYFNSAAGS